mmetsp:Transcript_33204/g.82697  ORF Transcript_33204/g.82697 Transcript_33204/m.82697 type:complete len:81 (-) Transcript_33204:1191-1433(-)
MWQRLPLLLDALTDIRRALMSRPYHVRTRQPSKRPPGYSPMDSGLDCLEMSCLEFPIISARARAQTDLNRMVHLLMLRSA